MNYIVLDMEWNLANSYSEMVKDPVKVKRMVYELTEEHLDYYHNCAENDAVWSQYVVSG